MATLRKRKTRTGHIYYVDLRIGGKRKVVSCKTDNKAEAKLIMEALQRKVTLGTFGLPHERGEVAHTVKTFFAEYFDIVAIRRKEALLQNQKNYYTQFVRHIGEDVDIQLIDGKMMDQYRAVRRATVSPATFDIERRFLHAAFQFAVKWKYLELNPIKFLKKEKVPSKKMYLTADEKSQLFYAIENYGQKLTQQKHKDQHVLFRKAVVFLLNTGLRREELHQLEWKNIDLAARKMVVVNGVKGDKMRHIPLNDTAVEILKSIGEPMFSNLPPSQFSKKFHWIVVEAGLKNIKLHSLRHTFATDLVERGVNIAVIQDLLGHSDIRTTLEYAKVNVEVKRSAVDSLNAGMRKEKQVVTKVLPFSIQANTKQ